MTTFIDNKGRRRGMPEPTPPPETAPPAAHLAFLQDSLIYQFGIDRLAIWLSNLLNRF